MLRLRLPHAARLAKPGQFIHLRVGKTLLRRPFSVYRATGDVIEILYRVKGAGTRIMGGWRGGDPVDALGPLGQGFTRRVRGERILLVGGGVGVAPIAFFSDRYPGPGVAVLGFRSSAEVCASERLAASGASVIVTTVDGSAGRAGLVTGALEKASDVDRVLVCGPWPMMAAVAEWAITRGLPCEAALEEEMGCGIGACLGCVVPTTHPDRPYARVCTEGPVMEARDVLWSR